MIIDDQLQSKWYLVVEVIKPAGRWCASLLLGLALGWCVVAVLGLLVAVVLAWPLLILLRGLLRLVAALLALLLTTTADQVDFCDAHIKALSRRAVLLLKATHRQLAANRDLLTFGQVLHKAALGTLTEQRSAHPQRLLVVAVTSINGDSQISYRRPALSHSNLGISPEPPRCRKYVHACSLCCVFNDGLLALRHLVIKAMHAVGQRVDNLLIPIDPLHEQRHAGPIANEVEPFTLTDP
ncbi:uncharacterized conserved protein [Zymobacter palmae]|uniref:Uncharacterized conserved protein n=1 Tax=Zymobacter palmae TaxID=33074 RepID=A0A348HEE8_9GAMM|nr:uncharacterized conserved protein [Zymobacter palmae]